MSAPQHSQAACHDPLDSMVDFSEYDKLSYHSPSTSPTSTKSQFTGRAVSHTPVSLPSSQPSLSGPSHNYEMYRQQTGIPQGAVASTIAVNQQMGQYNLGSGDNYTNGFSQNNDDFIDFGTAPSRTESFNPSEIDMDFESPKPEFFYPEHSPEFVNPSTIGGANLGVPSVLPPQTSNVGRLWPGMHQQQAALAKAQAQQKQQQQIIQQQRQNAMGGQQRQQSQRPRAGTQPTDPIVEEKISQLLNSMRQSSVGTDDADAGSNHMSHVQRMRKEEEDMDEDERLLASEEGKKLSSKERRQLRNKVSARAFRSRRKEYISQLEGEIAGKLNENQDLRSQNRALLEENTRLSDLTRMLLSSPSFSGFLDTLASNPAAAQTAQAVQQQIQPQRMEQPQRQVSKDVNPYAAHQQMQQHIGMTVVPEQTMDFNMLDLSHDGFPAYQPQVYSVLSIPEAVIDTEVLSGKSSIFSSLSSAVEKVEMPTVERLPAAVETEAEAPVTVDDEFDADPAFALFAASPISAPTATKSQDLDLSFLADLNIKPASYELVVVDNQALDAGMRRVERLSAEMEACVERLSNLTMHL